MKILSMLVLLLALAGAAAAQDVVVKTDKFTGRTAIVMRPIMLGVFEDGLSLVTLGLAVDAPTSSDSRIILVIQCDASGWQFLQGADVYALADGARIDLGHFVPQQGVVSTSAYTTESISAYVELGALAQMANAKDLQLKVGRYECHVKPKNARHLKEFIAALPPKK